MGTGSFRTFLKSEKGAVAATYALALTGLVMIGGVAFDYARMVTMDTELQSAADQAALAAATQLTGTANAINRAVAQASGLVTNQTIMANDGDSDKSVVTVASVTFFSNRADAEAGTNGFTANSQSAQARFVRVTVKARRAFYAFTPIVGAISSPNIAAAATAGLGSTMCKVPPLMICNPSTNPASIDVASLVGKGIRLKAKGQGAAWAPGDFGFLSAGNGASDLGKLIGYGNVPGECVSVEQPTTQPGAINSVMNEFNTRFDIYEGGDSINCYSGNLCPPSDNSRKDLVQNASLTTSSTLTKADCGINTSQGKGGNGWRVSPDPYRPTANLRCDQQNCSELNKALPDVMGYPRDICHAWSLTGSCANGRIGDGIWDVQAYWKVNYGTAYTNQVSGKTSPTRYDVYKWERSNGSASRQFNSPNAGQGNQYTDFKAAICRPGKAPGSSSPDRRVLSVAVVNCTGLSGSQVVSPLDWLDVFLVEPSANRTVKKGSGINQTTTSYTELGDIYVEVIGRSGQGSGGTSNQYTRRDKPYLVN